MRAKYKKVSRLCVWCGQEFEGTKRALYCSPSHSVLASRKRNPKPAPELEVQKWKAENEVLRAENNRLLELIDQLRTTQVEPTVKPAKAKKPVKGLEWLARLDKNGPQ
jgi:hypothetical protein